MSSELGHRCLKSGVELGFPDTPYPLADDLACSVEQEDMGLIPVTQLSFERFCIGIVDVEICKIDLSGILCFKPVHDGRQPLAGRSPEGEELDDLSLSRSQLNR